VSYRVKITPGARSDLKRLYAFLAEKHKPSAERSLLVLVKAFDGLGLFPHSYRRSDPKDPTLREITIPFGSSGYLALLRIRDDLEEVRVLAIRHQLEDDYL
jgi:plasmid stabilization system protein ParE